MVSRKIKLFVFILGFVFVISNAFASEVIKIGAIVPITGMGAEPGQKEHVAVKLAESEINAAGGINGKRIEIIVTDSASRPTEAVMMLRKLAESDKVLGVVGPHFSAEAEVTFPVGNKIGIVQICTASSKPGVAKKNRPYAFRNTLTEDRAFLPVVKTVKALFGVKKLALMYDVKEAVCASLGRSVYPEAAKIEGIEIINKDNPITFETAKAEFLAEVTKMVHLKADGCMVGALGPDALNFITEARRQGVPESFPFLAGTTVFDGEVPERGGKAVNNLFGGIIWYKEMTSAKNQRMVKGFQDWIPRFYSNLTNSPNAFAVSAYDAVYMIKEAIEKMGVTNDPKDLAQDRTKIKDYLAKLRNFEGVASKGFDEDGDGLKNVYVQKTWNGTWQLVKEWGPAQ